MTRQKTSPSHPSFVFDGWCGLWHGVYVHVYTALGVVSYATCCVSSLGACAL